ncbi:hypothetical protein K0T92_21715 [Paenibacillus oenotherae]|uniref:Uncharacterized protein n=1 Tax=Paenibacillus oenotherae TaxID=1435645 RepID=A0ABS7DBR6_9BACL|nr:hypothetical protein [Paenibacillus oenotherae]MBW7477341.1 hypothetical protein [Paenibacillus oenotherae]
MDLIKRYIYAVTHKLPEKQRADIEQELHGLIEDMLEHRTGGGAVTEKEVEEVLLELGSPQEMAEKYLGQRRYLIGPKLFDLYWMVVRIVVFSIVLALGIGLIIELFLEPVQGGQFIIESIASLISAAVQGFAWVTVVFAVMEYRGVKAPDIGLGAKNEWRPSQLAPIPNPKTTIKRSEPIASIIVNLLVILWLTSSIHYFGIIYFNEDGGTVIIPFFNEAVFRAYYPLIWVTIAISILKDSIKLVAGRWTTKLAAFHLLFNLASVVIAAIIFMDPAVWNAEFLSELLASGMVSAGSEGYETASIIWNNTADNFIYIVAVIAIIDSIAVIYKLFQARK